MSLPTPSSRKRAHTLTDATARRVQRPAPLRQAVYDAIVDLIVNGTLQRGQHLVENELAEYLGVSRQPVREALQRLQTDGWIDLRPAQGAFVHTPSEDEVDQLLAVRTVLETYSARLAAENATPEDVGKHRAGQAHWTRRKPVALVLPTDRTAARPGRLDRARRTDQGHRRRRRRSGKRHHASTHGANAADLPRPAAGEVRSSVTADQQGSGSADGIRSTPE
jgi:DNA-binding transcriptional regulator YhcF (GntR family)